MRTNNFLGRNWIDAEYDFTKEEWETLIDVALYLKRKYALNEDHSYLLKNKTLFMIFYNQSLRTRTTFTAGINQLGGFAQVLDPGKIYTPAIKGEEEAYSTERVSDVARVLSRVGDAIAIRMYGPPAQWIYGKANSYIKEFAKWADVPIINMECDKFHPTQALADMITIKEKFGNFKGKKIVMSWAYSGSVEKPISVPQSVILSATKMGMDVVLAHPKGLELDSEVLQKCKKFSKETGGSFEISNSMKNAFEDADIVYPKSWGAMNYFAQIDENGKKIKDENLKDMNKLFEANKHWICDEKKMKLIDKNGIYMHCLPADRDMEVTDAVIDGPQSVVFDEAENRLHAQKAIMAMIMGGRM
ncbi:MAG: N-acetylornithine carbamoyltransferase [Candidatus Cloacimonetes bacterium]|nr:N-acetylornithine carbamoyltransferase [Candidatus Cloacimonadota bacterium]